LRRVRLAALTLANFRSVEALAGNQIRFVATGQDPNDVARFLDLAFPLAALLLHIERRWPWRLLALGYLLLGLAAVVLTASRGGFLAPFLRLAGCAFLLIRKHAKAVLAGALGWLALALSCGSQFHVRPSNGCHNSIPAQGRRSHQRSNIWVAGWDAFARSPILNGRGLLCQRRAIEPRGHGSQYSAVHCGGRRVVCALSGIRHCGPGGSIGARHTRSLLVALLTVLLVWIVASFVDTVEENDRHGCCSADCGCRAACC